MTVPEVHILFDIKAQEIAANANEIFLPEEKDLLINLAATTTIKNKISRASNSRNRGNDETGKRIADLQMLITETVRTAYYKDEETAFSVLPHNFGYELEFVANIEYNCRSLSKLIVPCTSILTGEVAFPELSGEIDNPFKDFMITKLDGSGITTIFDITDYAELYAKLVVPEYKYELIYLVIGEIKRLFPTISVYWEKYGDKYVKDSFIFETTDTSIISFTIDIDGVSLIGVTSYHNDVVNTTNTKPKRVSCRLIRNESKTNLSTDPFYKTNRESPLVYIQDGRLFVMTNKEFVVKSIIMTYYRKPRRVSIHLNQELEFDSLVQDEIIDAAVRMAAAYTNSPNLRNILSDTIIND